MSKASEPKIKDFTGDEFTKITFSPDLPKFKMETLDDDTVALLSRRAYDIAAASKGVKVYLNGKKINVSWWFSLLLAYQGALRLCLCALHS